MEIGALFLVLTIPIAVGSAVAKPRVGFWSSQAQTCSSSDERGVCNTWINAGKPEIGNKNAPGAEGSLCGDAVRCEVETVANAKVINQWMNECPITGKITVGR